MALHVMRKEHMATWRKRLVGGSVATGLLKIGPYFLSKKAPKTR